MITSYFNNSRYFPLHVGETVSYDIGLGQADRGLGRSVGMGRPDKGRG